MIDAKDVMNLRQTTGAGVNDCKKALTEAAGDFEKAKELLRKWGGKIALKKATRETSSGLVGCYLHPTPATARVGVMVQFNCETDFVARNEEFRAFLKQVAQHIAASSPKYVGREDVPAEVIEKEKEIYREQVKGKPPAAMDKIIGGKLEKFFAECCLLDQPFVMDTEKTVGQMLTAKIATIGENLKVTRFARFEIGG
ncbi:MAG: elongation factor Ts [Planctomycetes bacterium]|nr:elongation factor Ts [Planctomycetota bacterium]